MKSKQVAFSGTKIWFVFGALFVCGLLAGVGVANWGRKIQMNRASNVPVAQESCAAVEGVLMDKLSGANDCDSVLFDLEVYKKLAMYGCQENREVYVQMMQNKNAIAVAVCENMNDSTCAQIEKNLQDRLPAPYADMTADERIDRAKIYAVMAERGCPENSARYVEMAKQELDIARGISDDRFNQEDTIEVVETYKRLKMQSDAEEIFEKAKKMTNPAIDFIMQIEKIINE